MFTSKLVRESHPEELLDVDALLLRSATENLVHGWLMTSMNFLAAYRRTCCWTSFISFLSSGGPSSALFIIE
jgi:hypothetical protein